jgi:hypothetical protein
LFQEGFADKMVSFLEVQQNITRSMFWDDRQDFDPLHAAMVSTVYSPPVEYGQQQEGNSIAKGAQQCGEELVEIPDLFVSMFAKPHSVNPLYERAKADSEAWLTK